MSATCGRRSIGELQEVNCPLLCLLWAHSLTSAHLASCTLGQYVFRFSDFCTLHESLRGWRHVSLLPKLPGKTWFARSCIGPRFLAKRQQALDGFVKELASNEKLAHLPGVAQFLGVPEHFVNSELVSSSM